MEQSNVILPIRIFITGTDNSSDEKIVISEIIDQLNHLPDYRGTFQLLAYAYEGSTHANRSGSPQFAVDGYLLHPGDADVVVCIVWMQFEPLEPSLIDPETGLPFGSRTEYEFLTAYRKREETGRPILLVYHYTEHKGFLKNKQKQVVEFLKRFGPDGDIKAFVTEISNNEELRKILRRDLELILRYQLEQSNKSGSAQLSSPAPLYFLPDNLPTYYVERSYWIDKLRESLLGSKQSVGVTTAATVHGQGGLGKSVLARAICDDLAIRSVFEDGILWATLGENADPVRHQRNWISALGGNDAAASNIESGKVELRRLLKNKAVLLVIDDVWNVKDLRALSVGGQKCSTLITTRNADLIENSILLRLDQMQSQESLQLLLDSGQRRLTDIDVLNEIAERLGHLPLALKIVGSMISKGIDWQEILMALDEGDVEFLSNRNDSVVKAIATSVNFLSEAERERYFELVIFPRDEQLERAILASLWKETASLQNWSVSKLLASFRDQALLDQNNSLHDLQCDYLNYAVPEEKKMHLHNTIVDVYKDYANWDTLKDSENVYLWTHFPYHVFNAGSPDKFRFLLTDYTFLKKKIKKLGVASLLRDLELLSDNLLQNLSAVINFGGHVLNFSANQLYNQVYGRLGEIDFLHNIQEETAPFVRQKSATLLSPFNYSLRNLDGHIGGVECCVFSPDDKSLLTGSIDGTLRLWDLETFQTALIFEGHTNHIRSAVFSDDGSHIVSASSDGTLRIWDVNTGKVIRVLEGHTSIVRCCDIHPNGKFVISGSDDQTLRLWSVENGRTMMIFEGHSGPVLGCEFSPEGNHIISSSSDGNLRLWDFSSGQTIRVFKGHSDIVRSCSFNLSGNKIVSGSADRTVRLWDVDTGSEIKRFDGHSGAVTDVKFSRNEKYLLSSSWSRHLILWDIETQIILNIWQSHKGSINCCCFSHDGMLMASGAWDCAAHVLHFDSKEIIRRFKGQVNYVRDCTFSPNGELVASGSTDKTISIWNAKNITEDFKLQGHKDYVRRCMFSNDSKRLLSCSDDHTILLWELENKSISKILIGHTGSVRDAVFTKDERGVVSASWDQTIRLWDLETGKEIRKYIGHSDRVNSVSLAQDGELIVSASDDRTLRVWELSTGQQLAILEGHTDFVRTCDISSDGRTIISSSTDGTLRLWDIQSKNSYLLEGHTDYVRSCVFSNDGDLALSVSDDGTLRVWNVVHRREIARWYGDGSVMSCAISPDRKWIVVGDSLNKVHFLTLENVL